MLCHQAIPVKQVKSQTEDLVSRLVADSVISESVMLATQANMHSQHKWHRVPDGLSKCVT